MNGRTNLGFHEGSDKAGIAWKSVRSQEPPDGLLIMNDFPECFFRNGNSPTFVLGGLLRNHDDEVRPKQFGPAESTRLFMKPLAEVKTDSFK